MPRERRVLPAPVIPAQAGIQMSRERSCLARIDRLRTRFGPYAGETPASEGRAVPRTPCPGAFAGGAPGENPAAHLPRPGGEPPFSHRIMHIGRLLESNGRSTFPRFGA